MIPMRRVIKLMRQTHCNLAGQRKTTQLIIFTYDCPARSVMSDPEGNNFIEQQDYPDHKSGGQVH